MTKSRGQVVSFNYDANGNRLSGAGDLGQNIGDVAILTKSGAEFSWPA